MQRLLAIAGSQRPWTACHLTHYGGTRPQHSPRRPHHRRISQLRGVPPDQQEDCKSQPWSADLSGGVSDTKAPAPEPPQHIAAQREPPNDDTGDDADRCTAEPRQVDDARHGRRRLPSVLDEYGMIQASAWHMAWDAFKYECQALRWSIRHDEWQVFERARPNAGLLTESTEILVQGGRCIGGMLVFTLAAIDGLLEGIGLLPKLGAGAPCRGTTSCKPSAQLPAEVQAKLAMLVLADEGIRAREQRLELLGERIAAPSFVRGSFNLLRQMVDSATTNRPVQRLWMLEEVSRTPYFAYVAMLHLYEVLNWLPVGTDRQRVHFLEDREEMYSLQVLEKLGGGAFWFDRFLAAQLSIVCYSMLMLLFMLAPQAAHSLAELLEAHICNTYGEFLEANESNLKTVPLYGTPVAGLHFYRPPDLYIGHGDLRTIGLLKAHPLNCRDLYDVFTNLRDHGCEHICTVHACRASDMARAAARNKTQDDDSI